MKLNDNYLSYTLSGERMLLSVGKTGFPGIARGNESAMFIIDCLQNETSEDEIVRAMLREYDVPEDTIRRDVKAVLDKLRSINAIDE